MSFISKIVNHQVQQSISNRYVTENYFGDFIKQELIPKRLKYTVNII